jgi:hypothetical protein
MMCWNPLSISRGNGVISLPMKGNVRGDRKALILGKILALTFYAQGSTLILLKGVTVGGGLSLDVRKCWWWRIINEMGLGRPMT